MSWFHIPSWLKRKPAPKPQPSRSTTIMYDSVTISEIPKGAEAVAGYVGGKWATYDALVKAHPNAHHVSIAVNASEDAMCLDVENGDASPGDVRGWYVRQKARNVPRPIIYANASTMPAVKQALIDARIERSSIRLWVAKYDGVARVPIGFDAKQYTDKALGRNLDASLCSPTFFDY